MKREIFISYSRNDKDLVHPFVEQISREIGKDCWIDLKGIESGEEFEHVIMKAIDECKVVLFMLSDSSLKSPWTKREVYYAENQGKRIVPVLVQGDGLRGWFQFHFGNIDFIDIRSAEHKRKLIENLRDWLGTEEAKPETEETGTPPEIHNNTDKEPRGWKKILTVRKLAIALCILAAAIGGGVYAFLHRIVYDYEIHGGMQMVVNGLGNYGFKDKSGKLVIPCKWKYAEDFSEGLARVQNNDDKYGYIDKTGKLVIPCKWYNAESFSDSLACVQNNDGRFGYIDKTGKLAIPCQWCMACSFSEGFAFVENDDFKYGLIDKTGELVVPSKWRDIDFEFSEGMMRVQASNGFYGFINSTGEEVIPCEYSDAHSFSEGLACVKDDYGYYGYIDKTGEIVLSCVWKDAGDFSEGLACVKDDKEKYGYIDKNGELVIPCQWDYADSFSNGSAIVEGSNGQFAINKSGKITQEFEENTGVAR